MPLHTSFQCFLRKLKKKHTHSSDELFESLLVILHLTFHKKYNFNYIIKDLYAAMNGSLVIFLLLEYFLFKIYP